MTDMMVVFLALGIIFVSTATGAGVDPPDFVEWYFYHVEMLEGFHNVGRL